MTIDPEILARLEPYTPIYVVLGFTYKNEIVAFDLEMNWSKRWTYLWRSDSARSIIDKKIDIKDGILNSVHKYSNAYSTTLNLARIQAFDALSDDCPIEIDFKSWLEGMDELPSDEHEAKFKAKSKPETEEPAMPKFPSCVSDENGTSIALIVKKDSKGANRVRVDFNPNNKSDVTIIKLACAALMDFIEAIDTRGDGEIARLKSLAVTDLERAAMWAVKAATQSGS